MKFKEIRNKIYSECKVIIDDFTSNYIQTHEETEYDDLEVIGIRSRDLTINGYNAGSYIEVLLK